MSDNRTSWEYQGNDRLSAVLDRLDAKFGKVEGATARAESKMSRFFSGIGGGAFMANQVAGAITILGQVMEATAGKAISMAMDFEQTKISFETLTGSVASGDALLGQLKNLADTTILNNTATYRAANTMLQFGVAQEKILPIMKEFGDIATNDDAKLQSLALVFGQISSAGRLQGQDLNQLVQLGFNPLEYIAARTGTTMAGVRKRMEEGTVSIGEVEAAFQAATGPGGKFHDMMNKISETPAGKLAILRSQLDNLMLELGQKLMPTIVQFMEGLTSFIDKNQEAISEFFSNVAKIFAFLAPIFEFVFKAFAKTLGLVASAFGFITLIIDKVGEKLSGLKAVFSGVAAVVRTIANLFIGLGEIVGGIWDKALRTKGIEDFGNAARDIANKGISGIYNQAASDSRLGGSFEERMSKIDAGSKAREEFNSSNAPSSSLAASTPKLDLGGGIKGVAGGGKSVRNVTVTFKNLVENINVNSTTVQQGINNIRQQIEEALVRVVHDSEIALSPDGN